MTALDDRLPRDETAAARTAAGGRPRKPYRPPELVIYGSLRELTLSGANDPPADSIVGGSTQTG